MLGGVNMREAKIYIKKLFKKGKIKKIRMGEGVVSQLWGSLGV